jgi:putative membrane protein
MSTTDSGTSGEPKLDSKALALDRTWLAHERTLMAWVRTATSMIGFGFTIYKFFQLEAVRRSSHPGVITPRRFAIIMISIGLITLFLATIARRRETKNISMQLRRRRSSLAEVVAGLIFLFGILVLVATALRG